MSALDPDSAASSRRPVRRAWRDVRAATTLSAGRPAWAAGLRAGIATVAPLLVDHFFHTGGSTWMSLAGFVGSLADKGGPYRTRAETIASLTVAGALSAACGAVIGSQAPAAVAATLIVALAAGLARAYGNAGSSVGVSALIIFVISLGYPAAGPGDALTRAAFVLAGGIWAMLVALVLWPLRPYRPARLAVGAVYSALADYADAAAAWVRTGVTPGPMRVRAALEAARATLTTLRRGRPGESGRGARLLVLTATADQLFGHLFGLADVLESLPGEQRRREAEDELRAAFLRAAGTARALASAVEEEQHTQPVTIGWGGDRLRERLADVEAGAGPDVLAHYEHAAGLLDRLAQYAGVAAAVVAGLNAGTPLPPLERPSEVEDPEPPLPWLAPLRASLAADSLVLHYALRLAIVAAAAVALVAAFHLRRGYWMTLTAIIILQPYLGSTSIRAVQRVLGTVVGGALTAGLAALFHAPLAILVLAFVGSVVSVALLPLNYTAYSIFLTPTFVLLAEAGAGDWHLAGLRILNTVLGGALALAGSRLLWPVPEARRTPAYLEAMLVAIRGYFDEVVRRFDDRSDEAGRAIRAARRGVGVAVLNAEESLQRLLDEHHGAPEEVTPVMTLITYARRFTASVAALALSRHSVEAPPRVTLAPFATHVSTALDQIATAVASGGPPTALAESPGLDGTTVSPLLRGRMSRLARQLRTLHAAVSRLRPGS
ncbi:MAG: FUSC family protein [Gemmatimonadales bacterium]